MKTKFITIEREYGSGGTKIAHHLAEETGVPCYGREILEAVSKSRGISLDDIERYEENVTNSFIYTMFVMAQASRLNTDMLTNEGHIYVAEQAEIKKLAANGRGIFLGHCAAKALEKREGVVRVFIRCSDGKLKRRRIVEDYGISETEADKVRKRFDKKRANYYYANTAEKWDDFDNYDIVIDSAKLGIEGCTDALKGLLIS